MRAAIFSDVHGNWDAFRVVLADCARRAVDELWCLGDVVGYGAEPSRCAEVVAALAGALDIPPGLTDDDARGVLALRGKLRVFVRGNHDAAVCGDAILDRMNDWAQTAIAWTAGRLSAPTLAFLCHAPLTYGDDKVACVHASPYEPGRFHYITDATVGPAFAAASAALTFFGHTHVPAIWASGCKAVTRRCADLVSSEKYLVNVGSVGQPRDGNARAAYVIYDDAGRGLEYVRVAYDVAAAAAKIRAAGLPEFLARRLAEGR